jgi:hypothetical protein
MSARILTVVQRNTKNTNQHQDALEPRAPKKTFNVTWCIHQFSIISRDDQIAPTDLENFKVYILDDELY